MTYEELEQQLPKLLTPGNGPKNGRHKRCLVRILGPNRFIIEGWWYYANKAESRFSKFNASRDELVSKVKSFATKQGIYANQYTIPTTED